MYIEKSVDIYIDETDFTTNELIDELIDRNLNENELKRIMYNLINEKQIYETSIVTVKERMERSSSDARTVLTDLFELSHHASNEQIVNELKNIL